MALKKNPDMSSGYKYIISMPHLFPIQSDYSYCNLEATLKQY